MSIPSSRPDWQPDDSVAACGICHSRFSMTKRKHHCRCCGKIFCNDCSSQKLPLPHYFEYTSPQRVCNDCAVPLTALSKALEGQLLAAQFFLRAHSLSFMRHLPDIGTRSVLAKIFTLARHESSGNRIVSVCTAAHSAVNLAAEKKRVAFASLLKQLKRHPFIMHAKSTCEYFRDKDAIISVTPIFARGSLRDKIYSVASNQSWQLTSAEKYSQTLKRKGKPLSSRNVSLYSRAILEAFRSLRGLRVPCVHVHSGNVMIDNESAHKCFLSVEAIGQSFVGLAPRRVDVFASLPQPPAAFSLSNSFVAQFAHLLYEMCTGSERDVELPMRESKPLFQETALEPFYELLCALFHGESAWFDKQTWTLVAQSEESLPSLSDLLEHRMFSNESVKLTNPDTLAGLASFDKIKLDREQKLIIKKVTENLHETCSREAQQRQSLSMSAKRRSVGAADQTSPSLSPTRSPAISPMLSPRNAKQKRKKKAAAFIEETPPKVLTLSGHAPPAATVRSSSSSSSTTAASKSSSSTSASASIKPAAAPPAAPVAPPVSAPAAPAPPPPSAPPGPAASKPPAASGGRQNLLASIRSANKSSMLKKVVPPR